MWCMSAEWAAVVYVRRREVCCSREDTRRHERCPDGWSQSGVCVCVCVMQCVCDPHMRVLWRRRVMRGVCTAGGMLPPSVLSLTITADVPSYVDVSVSVVASCVRCVNIERESAPYDKRSREIGEVETRGVAND